MKDHLDLNYSPKFINLLEEKPKLSAQKKQLVIYYLSSYFLKKTKKEILNRYDHHCFYWNTKEELVMCINGILGNSDFYDKREGYRGDDKIPDNSHTAFFLLYNFMTKQIAIQGYLKNKKKKIDYWENEVIEDIEQFTDYDFNKILNCVPVDYHIRDEQIKNALDNILDTFPVNRFYTYSSGYYHKDDEIGYLYKRIRNQESITLYFNRYSINNEKLDNKNKDKLEIHFLKKDKFIEEHNIVLKEDIYVKEKIYKARKSKINDLKNKNESNKKSIKKYQETIEASKSAISTLEEEIKERTNLINQKVEDLKNTIIEDIKIL